MAGTSSFVRKLGAAVKKVSGKRASSWYTLHMAAASRAITDRIPLVDLVIEVRDARVPLSSEYELLRNFPHSLRHIIVLNKMDLASRSQMKVWRTYFEQQNCISYGVNSHNKENIKEIGSHPNIYVLDAPGVLPPEIPDAEMCSKLSLIGTINNCLVGDVELAQYFLAILNWSDEYKKWAKLSTAESEIVFNDKMEISGDSKEEKRRKLYATDHTQDFVVRNVRQILFETVSSFHGNLEDEKDLMELVEAQFAALQKTFNLLVESDAEARSKVASKLLNLYRTGRLGHYTLDSIPSHS